jgi:arylsulfatase A-like enzyme
MTPLYIQAIEEADTAIGQLLQQMKDAGLYDDTFIILMTDHGGVERGHGGYSDAEMRIPWAIRGPGIKPGEMQEQFFTVNTAAIIAHIFDAPTPAEWAGRCNIRIR